MAIIGYARVSSKDQNLDRQVKELEEYGIDKLFCDKASGKNLDRKGFNELLEYVREGDRVVISSLDRLGRNYQSVIDVFTDFQSKGIEMIVLDMPILNQDLGQRELSQMFQTIIINVLSYVADNERKRMLERQQKGIEIAKEKGIYKGRPTKYHANATNKQDRVIFNNVVKQLNAGLSVSEIARENGITRPTVYKIKEQI